MARSRRWIRILRVVAWALGGAYLVMLLATVYLFQISRTLPDLGSATGALQAARTSIVVPMPSK